MGRCPLIISVAFAFGCGKVPTAVSDKPASTADAGASQRQNTEAFFVKWLEAHGHSDVVVDLEGVGVENNATRLRASLYGAKQHEKGGFVVEMEFTILLPSKRHITEFVAGTGKSEKEAINDSLLNFMLTTFHVVYKGFINANAPHLNVKSLEISGAKRDVIMGDILSRSAGSDKQVELNSMRREIQGVLKDLPLGPDPHWIKIVYSQDRGKPVTVAATLDNEGDDKLTDAVNQLHWPRSDGFYIAKQFIVIK
jgi:hypothetical protein